MYALLLGFITALTLTYAVIPIIIKVAIERRVYDRPNERSSHEVPTPSLGGIAIFAGTVCGVVLWTPLNSFGVLQYILAAFILIFLLGILDDLLPVSPYKKLGGQILVAIILSYKAGIRLTSFYGVFGIEGLSELAGFMLSLVAIVGIINAFNFIDGINGLAGSIGLINCAFFGFWFYGVGNTALAIVAISLGGAIAAFLRYNITPARIFMGDTGSLLIGTVCSILAISFIETNYKLPTNSPYVLSAAPAIALAVLILPIYDTIAVSIRRLMNGRSPFHPDKTHIHHQILDLGFSHSRTTVVLLLFNVMVFALVWSLQQLGTLWVLAIEMLFVSICGAVLYRLWKARTIAA